MLVSQASFAPVLAAGFAAAFVLPESLRLNNIDIDSLYPESLKAVQDVEHVVNAVVQPPQVPIPGPVEKTIYEVIATNPESVLGFAYRGM